MRILPTTLLFVSLVGTGAAQQAPAPPCARQNPDPVKTQSPAPDKVKAKQPPKDQGKAPPDKEPGAGQKGDDQEAPPAGPPRSKLPPPTTLFIEGGYGDWGLSGAEPKFRQYATPPTGWFLRDLRFSPMFKSSGEGAFFDLKGIGQDDYRAESRLVGGYGATQFGGFLSQSRFFDPTPNPVDLNTRRVDGLNLKQSLSPDFALSFQYRNDSEQKHFTAPFTALDQNIEYWDVVAGGKLGRGFANLNFSNLHYSDHSGTLANTTVQTTGLRYQWDPSPAAGIEAALSHVTIAQTDLPQSHLDTLSLSGDFALGSATDLAVQYRHRQINLPVVQSAYVRAQGEGTVNLSHRWKSWRAQVGLRLQNDERINGDQTNVDVPKWSTFEGRLSGRLPHNVKVSLRGYTQTLANPPSVITSDPRSLYWGGRDFFQAKLEGGSPEINAYLIYTFRGYRNSARSTKVTTDQFTVGGVWQMCPTVDLFAEYHQEIWSGKTDDNTFPTLGNFLPDSSTGIIQLNWNLPHRVFLSFSYTGFATSNDNPLLLQDGNTRGNFFTLSGRYRFPAGYELGLTVAPWTYRDRVVNTLDYNATVFMLTGSARF